MILVGTSGYNYPEWKGSFYPADLPAAKMLPFYAARFPTVEINYTFYRMPTEKLVAGWAAQTPPAFQLHAEGAAPHHARQPPEGTAATRSTSFVEAARELGAKLGALLFQLPPNLKGPGAPRRVSRGAAAEACTAAFEFRHRVVARRRGVRAAARRETSRSASPTARRCRRRSASTADYAYFRLRDEGYAADDIRRWAETIARETASLPRRVRVLQARRRRKGAGLRAAADGDAVKVLRL